MEAEIREEVEKCVLGTDTLKIQQMHPGLPLKELQNQLENCPCSLANKNAIIAKLATENENSVSYLNQTLLKFDPKNFEEFLWLYKTTSISFCSSINPDDSSSRMNLLRRTFQMNGNNWDANPVHLHLITKEIFSSLQYDKNRIYFSRKICNISRLSTYVSILLTWAVFLKTSTNTDAQMFRFYKFPEIIKRIKNIDIVTIKEDLNRLYILLESISFLLNTITCVKMSEIIHKDFKAYFTYKKNDLLELQKWCTTLNRMFDLKIKDNEAYNTNYSLISDLLELDILNFLEDMINVDSSYDILEKL